jgi:hypothetical protein
LGGTFLSRLYPTWTARIPPEVKEYLQNYKGYSAGFCIVEYYKYLKSQELDEKKKELEKTRNCVLQLEQDVLQLEQKNEQKQDDLIQKVKNKLMSASYPEYYIGKTIDGIKVTKEFLKECDK